MGQFECDSDREFRDLLRSAGEIVLPGTSGVRLPEQRQGAYYDVTSDVIVLTDGISAYGSC